MNFDKQKINEIINFKKEFNEQSLKDWDMDKIKNISIELGKIYFIDMNFKFHKKLNAENYEMRMSIENFKRLKDNFIAKFNFNIGSSIKGTFIALVSNNSAL